MWFSNFPFPFPGAEKPFPLTPALNQRGPIPFGPTLIQRFDLKRNIVFICIFLDASYFCNNIAKISDFVICWLWAAITPVQKNDSIKNHHIFRKPWTSAFRWHTLDTSWKILHWGNWQKCEKNPFLLIFRVRSEKLCRRPAFGQLGRYRTQP